MAKKCVLLAIFRIILQVKFSSGFLMHEQQLLDATLMVQYEVARRLVAPPKNKEYGILSIFTQFYTECEMLFKVSRNCFFPKPEVDSAVVRFKFKEQLPECDEKLISINCAFDIWSTAKDTAEWIKVYGI